ncbi:hypothetical protein BHM03_00010468 [Ensete ventricosum]|nr:hypothetical protein BHM03_00010468 [Ensete ventricosum]
MPKSGENQELPSWEGEVRVLEREFFPVPFTCCRNRCFIPVGGELVRTPGLTLVVPRGTTRSYGGRAGAIVWDEGVARHTTLMAHGGAGQYSRSPCRGARIVLSEPMNAAVLGGAVPVPSFQAARKEWRAVTEHSFRSSGGEVRSKGASFLDKRIAEGTSLLDVDPCSVTTEGVGELNDDILQQKLQEITRHRERLQQMEIELRARAIARSDILEVQNSFEGQLKEQIDFNANLKVPTCLVLSDNINKEQLHEREQHILELEMKLEEKDRELHAMKIDTEAVFSLGNELLTSIKYGQLNVQLHRVVQETILFKDEQLREAQAWIARVQEMDALQSSTNQSLQAELREPSNSSTKVGNGRFRPSPPDSCGKKEGDVCSRRTSGRRHMRRTLRGDNFFVAVFSSSEVTRKRGGLGDLVVVQQIDRLLTVDFDCYCLLPGGISLAATRLGELRRRRKERAFEEEGESREPWSKLVSMPFLDLDPVSPSPDDPDPRGNDEESRKEEDLEARGLG